MMILTNTQESDMATLRAFAIATADRNPNLLNAVERGWITPDRGLMDFIARVSLEIPALTGGVVTRNSPAQLTLSPDFT